MAYLLQEVAAFRLNAQRLLRRVRSLRPANSYQGTTEALTSLLSRLEDEFDQAPPPGKKRKMDESKKLRRQLRHVRTTKAHLADELRLERTAKVGHRLSCMWLAKICLSKPNAPSRTLAAFLSDWPTRETQQVSHYCISHVLDTFVEVVKEWNCQEITSHAAQAARSHGEGNGECLRIAVKHIHDESSMRVKSRHADESALEFWRGRYSKVQN